MTKTQHTATVLHPSTGEALVYSGTREVACATFGRGTRTFTNRWTGRSWVKDWTVTEDPAGAEWQHVGWSIQPLLKAQKAAHGTDPYYVETMAVAVA